MFAIGIRNPDTRIRNPLWYGIRHTEGWNPESRCWDTESIWEAGIRNPGPSRILLHRAREGMKG